MTNQVNENILTNYFLKFKNNKIELLYNKNISKMMPFNNIKISIIALVLAFIILISQLILYSQNEEFLGASNLSLMNLKNLDSFTPVLPSDQKDNKLENFIFYDSYILINNTLDTNNFNDFISNTNQPAIAYINNKTLLINTLCFTAGILGVYIFLILFSYFIKKDIFQKFYNFINIFLLSQSFNILTFLVNFYNKAEYEYIYLILLTHVLFKVVITQIFNYGWICYSTITLLSNCFEWIIYILAVESKNTNLSLYLTANFMISLTCIIITYINEKNEKIIFFLSEYSEKERAHFSDLVSNLKSGIISYSGSQDTLYTNQTMKNLIEKFKEEESDCIIQSVENKNKNKNEDALITEVRTLNNPSNNGILHTLNKLLSHLTEVNYDLPIETQLCLDSLNILDRLYANVISNEEFRHFTELGIINLQSDKLTQINTLKFQVMFRVVNKNCLDIVLNDVSKIVKTERENAILKSKSIYLSKVSHELKNPLSTIIELSQVVKEGILNKVIDKANLSNNLKYIKKLCETMGLFLNDINLFNNLKLPCNDSYHKITENLVYCEICTLSLLCRKCKICYNCVHRQLSIFDLKETAENLTTFVMDLSKLENTNKNNFELNLNLINDKQFDGLKIFTNEKLISSAIGNLLLNSYKTFSTKINLNIKQICSLENRLITTIIEIENNSIEIRREFLELLNMKDILFYDKIDEKFINFNLSEILGIYFEIYISFFFLKKLDSSLDIKTSRFGTTFKFEITNTFDELKVKLSKKDCIALDNSSSLGSVLCNSQNTIIYLNPTVITLEDKQKIKDERRNSTIKMLLNFNDIPNLNVKYQSLNLNTINSNLIRLNSKKLDNLNDKKKDADLLFDKLNMKNNGSSSNDKLVLIVDDEHLIRKTVRRHFKNIKEYNFNFFEASNCFEAIEILHLSLRKNKYFDLVIIDEFMPNMFGSTLIKLFNQLYKENNFYKFNIISYTAFDTPEKRKIIMESGADAILSKPSPCEDFKTVICKFYE